jgi:putative endonuclease
VLVRDGWSLVARNWRGGGGEIDLIALRDGALRLVEVKARTSAEVDPAEALHATKRGRLLGAAQAWLREPTVAFEEVCFLVVLVNCFQEPWTAEWLDDAFDGS